MKRKITIERTVTEVFHYETERTDEEISKDIKEYDIARMNHENYDFLFYDKIVNDAEVFCDGEEIECK